MAEKFIYKDYKDLKKGDIVLYRLGVMPEFENEAPFSHYVEKKKWVVVNLVLSSGNLLDLAYDYGEKVKVRVAE